MPKLPKITSLLFLCNILRKTLSNEVDLLHAHKHESFVKFYTVIFDGDGQAFPEFPK